MVRNGKDGNKCKGKGKDKGSGDGGGGGGSGGGNGVVAMLGRLYLKRRIMPQEAENEEMFILVRELRLREQGISGVQ